MICRICQAREASCRITERQADGSYKETVYCEPCLLEAVPDWMSQPTRPPSLEALAQMISAMPLPGGGSIARDEAARIAFAVIDQWGKRKPPPYPPA